MTLKKHFVKVTFILITIVSGFLEIYSQHNNTLQFEKLSLEDGIAHNLVYCMMQDNVGFMWFGTMYGLIRYDGQNYRRFSNDPNDPNSLSYNDIVSLFQDSSGKIWIGTWEGGINIFDPETEKFVRQSDFSDSVSVKIGRTVWDFEESYEKDKRFIWLATQSNGVISLELEANSDSILNAKIRLKSDLNLNIQKKLSVSKFMKDFDGDIWAATNSGVLYFTETKTQHFTTENGLPSNSISSFVEDENRNIWIGTASGLAKASISHSDSFLVDKIYKYDPKNQNSLISDNVSSLMQDKVGRIWVGTSAGLSYLTKANQTKGIFYTESPSQQRDDGLSGSSVITMLEDASGKLWFGTYYGGIHMLNNAPAFIHKFAESDNYKNITNKYIFSIFEDSFKKLWVSSTKGTYRIDALDFENFTDELPGNHLMENVNVDTFNLGSSRIHTNTFAESNFHNQKQLWIGTSYGLYLTMLSEKKTVLKNRFLRSKDDEISISSNFITKVLIDQFSAEPTIWVGTFHGLNRIKFDNNFEITVERFLPNAASETALQNGNILSLNQDADGHVWVGTYAGLSKFVSKTNSFKHYINNPNNPSSLSNNYVYTFLESKTNSQNTIWFGTASGLNKFNPITETFSVYNTSHGLPNDVINGIVEDENGSLWISTNKGICKFDPVSEKAISFDIADGLESNLLTVGNILRRQNGSIWLGSINGLNYFYPKKLVNKKEQIIPILSAASISGNSLSPNDLANFNEVNKIELSHQQTHLSLHFSLFNFGSANKRQLMYSFNSKFDDWKEASDNSINLAGLSPGKHVLKVTTVMQNQELISESIIYEIIVNPPFWQTLWFYSIIFTVVGLLSIFAHRFRLKMALNQANLLEQTRRNTREQFRSETARNYHDQMGHQLATIGLYSELLRRELEKEKFYSQSTSEYFEDSSNLDIRKHVEKISAAGERLSKDTRDFIWTLNPANDSFSDLALHICHFAETLFEDNHTEVSHSGITNKMRNVHLPMQIRQEVLFIFKEAITNVFKHAKATRLSIKFDEKIDSISILINDNGDGFQSDTIEVGNGMENMTFRAKKINGILQLKSNFLIGTTVELVIPKVSSV